MARHWLMNLLISVITIMGSASFASVETAPLQGILGVPKFEQTIKSPSQIAICGRRLVVYSVLDRSLTGLDRITGAKIFSAPLRGEKNSDVSALACKASHLLVLTNRNRTSFPEIQSYALTNDGGDSMRFLQTYRLPRRGRATDLLCSKTKCSLLQEKVWESEDLNRWREVPIPQLNEITLSEEKLALDPFADWQNSLILAKGHYSKFTANSKNEYALLDRHRAQFVVREDSQWRKRGSFGVWEGSLLDPNSIAYVADDVIAISDAKLKALFFFKPDGSYLGIAKTKVDAAFSPLYPLGLAAADNILYISDFRKNTVTALEFPALETQISSSNTIQVRQNLFRRPEVTNDRNATLCLACHDGVESNQLLKFVVATQHQALACGKCHDSHHENKFPHNLRSSETNLCASCHAKFNNPAENHVWKRTPNSNEGGACIDCHGAHADGKSLLKTEPPALCLGCHKDRAIKHRGLAVLSMTELGQKSSIGEVRLHENNITCFTCHETHLKSRKEHFLLPNLNILTVCASCHGPRAEKLYRNFHRTKTSADTKKGAEAK